MGSGMRCSALFPYTTLFRSPRVALGVVPVAVRLREEAIEERLLVEAQVPATEPRRSEEHTSELQSRFDIVCRLLLEKKKKTTMTTTFSLFTYLTTFM